MTIKQQGGIFGRKPTFSKVDVEGSDASSFDRTGSLGKIVTFNDDGSEVGAIGTNGNVWFQGPSGTAGVEFANGMILPWRDGARANGSIALGSSSYKFNGGHFSNNLVMDSGNGIDFSATSGTGTSELFDDYEEGTWTPTVNVGTATAEYANYTKIGRQVIVSAYLHTFSDTSTATNVQIGGLPFTSSSNNRTAGSMFGRNIAAGTGVIQNSPYIASSATTINLFGVFTGSFDPIQFADFDGSTQLYVTISYIT